MPAFFQLKNQGAEIRIYNVIAEDFGFSAQDLKEQLDQIAPDTPLTVRILSDGGSVFQGLAIYQLLRQHKGTVTTINDGIAASIAASIFLAGDVRQVQPTSFVMLHRPTFGVQGNADDFRDGLDLLVKAEEQLMDILDDRASVAQEQLDAINSGRDVYFTAEEALAAGLATEIIPAVDVAAHASLKTLVAKALQGVYQMNFETWLKAYCEPIGLDVDKLTAEQRKALEAKYKKETQTPPSTPPTTPAALGTTQNPFQATTADGPPADPTALQNQAIADNLERVNRIQELGAERVDLNEDYLKSLGVRGKTSAALVSHAIREKWSVEKFELELHKSKKVEVTAATVHTAPNRTINDNHQAVQCAMLRQLGVPEERTNKITRKPTGISALFSQEVREAADDPRLSGLSMGRIFEEFYVQAYGRRPDSYPGTRAFISDVQGAMRKLQASGGDTQWAGLTIFDDLARKILWAAYEAQETTWQEWVMPVTVTDFKTNNAYRMHMNGGYQQVGAGGELEHGTLSNDKYTVAANTYGKIVGLDRRDLINDDLGALNGVMTALGVEGARFLEELFYVHFMVQTTTLFPTAGTFNNYISGAGTVLGVDGLTEAEKTFRRQVQDDAPIGVAPDILLVGTANAVKAAELFTQTQLQGLQTANAKQRPDGNPHVGKFRPVVSGYLDNTSIKVRTATASLAKGAAITNQTQTLWFLLGTPSAMGGIVTGAFLNGNQRPVIEQSDSAFEVLGLKWRAYHDAGAGNGDPKLGVQSKGAA